MIDRWELNLKNFLTSIKILSARIYLIIYYRFKYNSNESNKTLSENIKRDSDKKCHYFYTFCLKIHSSQSPFYPGLYLFLAFNCRKMPNLRKFFRRNASRTRNSWKLADYVNYLRWWNVLNFRLQLFHLLQITV